MRTPPEKISAYGTQFYSNATFNRFMPLSVVYTAAAHLALILLKPFPCFRLVQEPLRPEDCFSPACSQVGTERGSEPEKRHVAIVTGSNTGIGLETASSLVHMGYDVILACRSRDKGEQAAQLINNRQLLLDKKSQISRQKSELGTAASPLPPTNPGKAIFLHPLDLSSLNSVRSFAEVFQARFSALNILVNNAGINTTGRSVDGMDLCFQTNFVGHYLLTRLLLPQLLKARNSFPGQETIEAGRVVNLSSVTHHFSRHDEERHHHRHGINGDISNGGHDEEWWRGCILPGVSSNTYKESKMAAVVFTAELNKRYGNDGLRAISVNPGAVNSDIWRNYPKFLLKYVLGPVFSLIYIDSKKGSRTSLVAAVGNLPKDAVYLQPYWQPWIKRNYPNSQHDSALSSFRKWYRVPFPLFEMLGPYIGHAIADPRLPNDVDKCSSALWNTCQVSVGLSK